VVGVSRITFGQLTIPSPSPITWSHKFLWLPACQTWRTELVAKKKIKKAFIAG
jgi:hypothetical protein